MRVISLFSGAGGLDLGFYKAGSRIVYANDIQKDFCDTYRENIGSIEYADIEEVDVSSIADGDAVIGGFPCLGFTIGRGHRRKSDPREEEENFLYQEFLRVVEEKNPKLFLMENVPGMKGGPKFEDMFNQILVECEHVGHGYIVEHEELNVLHWGVPQDRRRVIILGIEKEAETTCPVKNFLKKYPPITHLEGRNAKMSDHGKLRPYVTIKEAIGDLPIEESDRIPNHVGSKHKVKIRDYPGNRPLYWNSLAPTITGRGSLTGGPVIHPHPSLKRRLTVRESARLQSFPDDFVFKGSMTKGYAQVGNAVPPLFAFRLAQAVMMLLNYKPKKYDQQEWDLPWAGDIPRLDHLFKKGLNGRQYRIF